MLLSPDLLHFIPTELQVPLESMHRLRTFFGDAFDDLCMHDLCMHSHCILQDACVLVTLILGCCPLIACCLVDLNKNPGICPISICEMVRCIIAKAVLSVVTENILKAAGSEQLCASQIARAQAPVHPFSFWTE